MPQILFSGSREWTDYALIRHIMFSMIDLYGDELVVIEGGAPGADSMARTAAENLGVPEERNLTVPAKWYEGRYYNANAGHERNIKMLKMLDRETDFVIAFHDGISGGTAHTIEFAKKYKITTIVYYSDGREERFTFDSST